ncbi:MAG: hypothetical protein AAF502_22955 [Bacteroidota bacterium]
MKSLFTLILFVLPLIGFSQTSGLSTQTLDQRLIDAFEPEYLQNLQSSNAFLIEYYTIFLDHGYEIQEFPEGKLAHMESVDIEAEELENFNVLHVIRKYELERSSQAFKYYRLGDTQKVLVLYSEDHFAKKLNELTGRKH